MKFYLGILVLLCLSTKALINSANIKNETKVHYLKRTNKANEEFFLFDGEKYSQEQIDMTSYYGNCYIRYNSTIYDLTPLSKYGSFFFKTKDSSTIEYNICQNVISQCDHKMKGLVVSSKENSPCRKFAGGWNEDKQWSWNYVGSPMTNEITLLFPKGDICNQATGERYQVTMKLTCNDKAKILKLTNDGTFDTQSCNNTISAESSEACPKEVFFSWWNRTPLNKYWLAGILFVLGTLFMIIGNKFFSYVVAVIIASGGTVIIKALVSPFYSMNIYVCLGIGICLAIIFHFAYTLTPYLLGGFLGFFTASFAYTIILVWFPGVNPHILFYSCLAVCIIILVLLLHYIFDLINILITSVIGAYLSVRGISIFLKGFPDETYTSELVEHFEFGQLKILFGGKVIVYVVGMIALAIVGVIIQLGIKSKGETQNNNTDTNKEHN